MDTVRKQPASDLGRHSPAFRRFRSIAQFVQATIVLSKSRNGAPRLSFDQATDATLLIMEPVGLPDPSADTRSCLVTSNLVAQLTKNAAALDSSENLTDEEIERIESRALELFDKASYISPYKRLPIAVSVVAFFNEFAMGGMAEADFSKAERLYTLAAGMNCTFAQARLAFLKMHGRPSIKINQTIAEMYRNRLNTLSKLSSSGPEAALPPSSSLSWLHVMALNHHPAAQFCLGLCHYNGIGASKNNTSSYIWCHRAAVQGHPGAMNMLGNLYTEGHGTTKTPTLGLRWYIRAAERKDAAAIYNIGTLFERGIAVDEDSRQAYEWYVRASVFGSVNAQNVLGIFYEQGVGVAQCPEKAVQYYKTAAGNGHPHAMYNLARCYHDGFGVLRDDSVSLMWFRMASEQGHLLSILSVAVCFDAGIGVHGARSIAGARSNYMKAAKKGSKEAKSRLAEILAMEMLVAARPLLAGRMLTPVDVRRLRRKEKMPQMVAPPVAPVAIARTKYTPAVEYDDATEELLARLGFNYDTSLALSPSYYFNKSVETMMNPRTSTASPFEHEMVSSRTYPPGSSSGNLMDSSDEELWDSCSNSSASSEDERELASQPTTIVHLPSEIILHILSFLNEGQILDPSQVLQILKISGNRGTLSKSVSKSHMLDSFGVRRVAVWIEDKRWCHVCREKSRCDKIKHYMTSECSACAF
ncbi:hypothetical protein HDU98_004545 [Podochytrium sp. JEL0797]|nr:hypothetical protein HDU98_004545 [Podochytrium sp. JEL0797]